MNILITGATGFIGRHLVSYLITLGYEVTSLCRSPGHGSTSKTQWANTISIPDITEVNAVHLNNIDTVIHLAGIAHNRRAGASEYHRVNVQGTRQLLDACIEAGVKRIIYLSSIKALAERSTLPLKTTMAPAPEDDYGTTKLEAERLLIASDHIETIIVRVPLVYGAGVKGNFARLVKLVDLGVPLPFVSIQNKRSYLGIRNLCDFLTLCIEMQKSTVRTFHVSDGASVSLSGLVRGLYEAMGRSSKSFWIPEVIVVLFGLILLGPGRAHKLFGDLELDLMATTRHTGWLPKYSLQQGLTEMFPMASSPGRRNHKQQGQENPGKFR